MKKRTKYDLCGLEGFNGCVGSSYMFWMESKRMLLEGLVNLLVNLRVFE